MQLHDPYRGTTPSQRLAAAALTARRARFAAKAIPETSVVAILAPVIKPECTLIYRMWFDDLVAEAMRQLRPVRPIRMEDIQVECALFYGFSRADLMAPNRTHKIVMPRHVAMYLARTLTGQSFLEIARRFGGRDHSTILHGVRKISQLIERDRILAGEIEKIKSAITARVA